jgi:hypothetical protein
MVTCHNLEALQVVAGHTCLHAADVITRLTMPSRSCDDDVFIVHRRGDTSVYATAKWNARGLVACLLPHGVLVCTYQAPQSAHTVADLVERFSAMLRT